MIADEKTARQYLLTAGILLLAVAVALVARFVFGG